MVPSRPVGDWRRWTVASLGLGLCGMVVGGVWVAELELDTHGLLHVVLPTLLSLGVLAHGGWLLVSDRTGTEIQWIAVWSVVGGLVLGAFASFEVALDPVVASSVGELLLGVTEGVAVGSVVGQYDVRHRDHTRAAEATDEAIAASIDGIAVLDEDGAYTRVNQAHADVYGYESPEELIGESWRLCYADEEVEVLEDEVFPELEASGAWRGTLVGQRRDGSSFPQEVSLSMMDSGGMVCVVRDISDRSAYEHQLAALHEVHRGFMAAENEDEIAELIVEAVEELFGLPITVVWEFDSETNRLVPVAATGSAEAYLEAVGLDGVPTHGDDSDVFAWFESRESVLVEEYDSVDRGDNEPLSLETGLYVPIGSYGMLGMGAREPYAITETDQDLAEILVSNAEAAIEREVAERDRRASEQQLRTIVENAPLVLFAVNQDREVTFHVGQGLEAVGLAENELADRTIEDVVGESGAVIDAVDATFEGETVDTTADLWGRVYQVWFQPIFENEEVTRAIGVAMDVTDQERRARGIRSLHESTRSMMQETDESAICRVAVETAEDALELPLSAIWLLDEDGERLEPVATAEGAAAQFDDVPTFERGEGLAWEVFEEGEARVYDDVSTVADRFNEATAMRSEVLIPIGDFGVFITGSTEPDQFEETDIVLAQLLAANTRTALERAAREEELHRHADQMEFFNSILRHDVLNGMTVIRGRAELLADTLEGQELRDAETIIEWCDDVGTIIQRVRTVLAALTGEGDTEFGPVDLSAVIRSEVDRVAGTYPTATFETDVGDELTVRANELLGEVIGNILTNAVAHNDPDGLEVTVETDVRSDEEVVVVRIADNGVGVPDVAKEAIFRRDETGHAKSTGSGFGLFFVDVMVTEYGGDVWVEDSDSGGAAFVIELPTW